MAKSIEDVPERARGCEDTPLLATEIFHRERGKREGEKKGSLPPRLTHVWAHTRAKENGNGGEESHPPLPYMRAHVEEKETKGRRREREKGEPKEGGKSKRMQ